jgi:hypothetical protein
MEAPSVAALRPSRKEYRMTTETDHREALDRPSRVISIDDREYPVPASLLSGREVLEIAGRHPVEDFIVYWLGKDKVLKDLGLDLRVHIQTQGVERFLTFESDRSYRFEIEGKREDWGAPKITEETLRGLAGVDAHYRVWLDRKGEPDRLIERGEFVDLTQPGTEKFYVVRTVTLRVVNEDNGHEIQLEGYPQTKVESIIEDMYRELKVSRQPDDRLRCDDTGADVFGFGQLTLEEYLEAGHCRCLVWLFAGGTGGASWR